MRSQQSQLRADVRVILLVAAVPIIVAVALVQAALLIFG
jgi:hypothetical protein